MAVFWDVTQLVEKYRRVGGDYCLRNKGYNP